MRLVDRYIGMTVLKSIALVTLMLMGLQIFILFVNQLPDLGQADYHLLAALHFVSLEMPYEVYLLFPMASLLGCLMGLGQMASHHELVVLRAAGMSIAQISMAVVKVALVLILVVTALGESILPGWVQQAHQSKLHALSGGQSIQTPQGFWVRDHNDFIKISAIAWNHRLDDVHQFHFDEQHHLMYARHIDTLQEITPGHWLAQGVQETSFLTQHLIEAQDTQGTHTLHTRVSSIKTMAWEVPLAWQRLGVSQRQLDEFTLPELYQILRASGQANTRHETLIFTQRLMQPFTTLVMMLLAIPFIFGPLRSSSMGSKLLTGALVGFGFYIINRFLGSASQLYQWSSILAATAPTLVCALLGIGLMKRGR